MPSVLRLVAAAAIVLASGCTLILGDRPGSGSCGKMAEVFVDEFAEPTLSAARWGTVMGDVAVDGGRLRLTTTGTASQVTSTYAADLRDSSFTIDVDATGFVAISDTRQLDVRLRHDFHSLADGTDLSAIIDLRITGFMLQIYVSPGPNPSNPTMGIGGPVTSFIGAYDAVQERVLRVREAAGVLYFEAAPTASGPWMALGDYGTVPGQDTRFTSALTVNLSVYDSAVPAIAYFAHVNSGGSGSFCPIDVVPTLAATGLAVGGAFESNVYGAAVSAGPPLELLPISLGSGADLLTSRTFYDLRGRALIVPVDSSTISPPFDFVVGLGVVGNGGYIRYRSAREVPEAPDSAFVDGAVGYNPNPSDPNQGVTRSFCNNTVATPPRLMRLAEDGGDLVLSYSLDGTSFVDCGRFPFASGSPLFQPDALPVGLGMDYQPFARNPGEHVSFF
jgi:hypothetical protein